HFLRALPFSHSSSLLGGSLGFIGAIRLRSTASCTEAVVPSHGLCRPNRLDMRFSVAAPFSIVPAFWRAAERGFHIYRPRSLHSAVPGSDRHPAWPPNQPIFVLWSFASWLKSIISDGSARPV